MLELNNLKEMGKSDCDEHQLVCKRERENCDRSLSSNNSKMNRMKIQMVAIISTPAN